MVPSYPITENPTRALNKTKTKSFGIAAILVLEIHEKQTVFYPTVRLTSNANQHSSQHAESTTKIDVH